MARILLVEDDDLVCRSLRMTLEAYGHAVESFADGRKAVELLRQQGGFDVVITDILMPDMDGLELIRAVRGLAPDIRVIAMSGGGRRGNQDFLQFASTFGADVVLSKPFTGEALMDALTVILKP